MASKTYCLSVFRENIDNESKEAQEYLSKMYPDIEYIESSDSFRYRGIEFDYFRSGVGFDFDNFERNGKNSYLLVDKENSKLWLFTYGDLEERWRDYLKRKNEKRLTPL